MDDFDLRKVSIFHQLNPEEAQSLEAQVEAKSFEKGELIFRRGDVADALYIIKSGEIDISIDSESETVILATITAGNFFGERALIVNEPRNASCVAASERVEVFALDKASFKHALETSASFKEQIQTIYFQRQ